MSRSSAVKMFMFGKHEIDNFTHISPSKTKNNSIYMCISMLICAFHNFKYCCAVFPYILAKYDVGPAVDQLAETTAATLMWFLEIVSYFVHTFTMK